MKDLLGDRMKEYESQNDLRLMKLLPTFARVDGRAFHSFTKGLNRPFDESFSLTMIETAKTVAALTNSLVTYTQSDEITYFWHADRYKSEVWFDGRHSKMVSQIAALTTLFFNQNCQKYLPEEYLKKNPSFDARVWQVPNIEEAANVFLWRQKDAMKNSVSMAAQTFYSHKQLLNKSTKERKQMLLKKGVNWDVEYPESFKKGTYIKREVVSRPFSEKEISKLPLKHEARNNKNLLIDRNEFLIKLDFDFLKEIKKYERK